MEDHAVSFRKVNLNLLPVLLEILRTRNITQAATSLCLTQSATSGCLRRLRELFNDDLLIRRGREMVLTEKAKELLPRLEELLAKTADLVESPDFDPKLDKVRFRIATADWVGALLISKIDAYLMAEAPNVSLEFLDSNLPSVASDLKKGFVDLLIGPKEIIEWAHLSVYDKDSDYQFAHCFGDELVAVTAASNSAPEIEKDLDTYLGHPHITFNLHPRMHASLERQALNESGLFQNDRIHVSQFAILPYLVATTGGISVVPSTLAKEFSAILPIRTFRSPVHFRKIDMIMVWSKARQRDQALRWLCGIIPEAFAGAGRMNKGSPKKRPGKGGR